jgi:L-lactate dehydrogenase complex protein LldG
VRRRFQQELERAGGRVHHGPAALERLAAAGGVVTGCIAAVAETGTVVLSSRLSGGRRAGLVEPVHVVEARPPALVADLRTALARAEEELRVASVVTLVTGPSRTADIEGVLVRGVHGPRELHVVFVEGPE